VIFMVEMNATLIIGALVFLVVILYVGIPVAQQIIVQSNPMGTIAAEVWNGTAGLAHTMSFTPILSIASVFKANLSSATNNVSMAGFHGNKSLSTATPATAYSGFANLTVVCQNATGEGIAVQINGHSLGTITGCPTTFTNVNHAWLTDPATTLVFLNNGSSVYSLLSNTTAVNQGNGTRFLYFTEPQMAGTTGNLTVNSDFISGDTIAVYLNGVSQGNLSAVSDVWTGQNITNATSPLNITMVNSNVKKVTVATNSTAWNTSLGFIDVYLNNTPVCDGANITVTYAQEAGTNITLRYNGHALGTNLSGTSPQTWANGTVGGPDNGWECDNGGNLYDRVALEGDLGTNNTNITSVAITYWRYPNATTVSNVTFAYDYNQHQGNFTNASLSYYGWRNVGNYTSDTTSITPGFNGTYETAYTYGTTNSGLIGNILGMIPVFLGLVALFILAKMFGLLG